MCRLYTEFPPSGIPPFQILDPPRSPPYLRYLSYEHNISISLVLLGTSAKIYLLKVNNPIM